MFSFGWLNHSELKEINNHSQIILHNVSIRGNYQKDVRALKEAIETKED